METRSPRKAPKRSHAVAIGFQRQKASSPLPRCDSRTAEEHTSPAHSKLRRKERQWSPISGPVTKDYEGDFPALESTENRKSHVSPKKARTTPKKEIKSEAVVDFSGFQKDIAEAMGNKSWAQLAEEEESMKDDEDHPPAKSPRKQNVTASPHREAAAHRRKPKFVQSTDLTAQLTSNILRSHKASSSSASTPPRRSTRHSRRDESRGTKGTSQSSSSNFDLRRSPPTHSNIVDALNDDDGHCGLRRSPRKRPGKHGTSSPVRSRRGDSASPNKSPIRYPSREREDGYFSPASVSSSRVSRTTSSPFGTPKDLRPGYVRPEHTVPTPEHWDQPKLGWCEDEKVIAKREKDIQKGYASRIYQRYINDIPNKRDREKGLHPSTPNKYINYSRRSWDSQTRLWRKMMYVWAGESTSDMSSFLSTSQLSSRSTSECGSNADPEEVKTEPEVVRELLEPFDIDSQKGLPMEDDGTQGSSTVSVATLPNADDENTLTADGQKGEAPVDFSCLNKD